MKSETICKKKKLKKSHLNKGKNRLKGSIK
jgi:hypothetical protein